MKIIIDAREAVRNPTGIGNVGRKFVDFIVERYKGNDEYFIFPNPEKWNKEKKKKGFKLFNFIFHIFWKQIYIPFKAFVLKADVILSFAPESYFLTTKPIIITVYDMIFFKLPVNQIGIWGMYWKYIVPVSIRKATKIIAISEATKRDVVEIVGINNSKIRVLYLGVDNVLINTSLGKNLSEIPYFLFVGHPEPRRGIEYLIEAFDLFLKKNPAYKLIIVGKDNEYRNNLIKKVRSLGIEEKVFFTGFISSEKLSSLYLHAEAFIYPSLYEGFGLTILEAMAHGCPVITTNISSLPEVANDAAITILPSNVEDLLNAMLNIRNDPSLRSKMVAKGYENIKRFRWEFFETGVLQIINEFKLMLQR